VVAVGRRAPADGLGSAILDSLGLSRRIGHRSAAFRQAGIFRTATPITPAGLLQAPVGAIPAPVATGAGTAGAQDLQVLRTASERISL